MRSSLWRRLKTELGAGKSFSVVHIASHFVVETGSGYGAIPDARRG